MPRDDARYAVPTAITERSCRSFPARTFYQPGVQYPPAVAGVAGAIDIHCHAHEGQQDALAVARLASQSGMRGILFKTIVGRPGPAEALEALTAGLGELCAEDGTEPIACRVGAMIDTIDDGAPGRVAALLDAGVTAMWLPVTTHANTFYRVGGLAEWIMPDAEPGKWIGPLSWDEARAHGCYLLDDGGGLKQPVREIVRLVAERDAALFLGHASHDEIFVLADEIVKCGITRAVIDHPFSPFVDLSADQMQQAARAGITLNFTFDELSPALGIDPGRMYDAIRAVGPEHCTLSSDAGDALFPNSVECMRLISGYMSAYGLNEQELRQVVSLNPARIMGLDLLL